MRGDRYSRLVALLKVSLPLLALGLLSTLFLISRAVDPPASIPFADAEVQQRLSSQQVTGPYFSGTSVTGDQIAFVAETVTTPNGETGINRAEQIDLQVEMVSGTRLTVKAAEAEVDIPRDRTDLTGDVEITTSTGYVLNTDLLQLRIARLEMVSPDRVTGQTPVGDIEAGQMRVFTPEGQTESLMLFTDGVKLIYRNEPAKE
jgi:lipopolysaccharide export system protein LptC